MSGPRERRPRIGIPTYPREGEERRVFALPTAYVDALRGGDLHAHLPDAVGEAVCHRESQQRHTHHPVRLAPDSALAGIYGRERLDVASWHHQGVQRLGRGLRAVAWADDGTVEAVEDPRLPELLAVQWHPELGIGEGSPHLRPFRAFVERARGGG